MWTRNRRLFLLVVAALLVTACGVDLTGGASPPEVSPSPPPSPSSAIQTPESTASVSGASTAPTCSSHPREPGSYVLVGWRADRIVAIGMTFPACGVGDARYEILSADPAVGTWRSEYVFSIGMPYGAATDGRSVAVPRDAYGLPPLVGGGYLVTGAERLLRIASDGSGMRSDPLPASYVAVAPTSDPERFIIAPVEDARVEYGLGGAPFRAYLWDRTSASLRLVARSVNQVAPAASTTGLAFLVSHGAATTSWSLVRPDGSVRDYGQVNGAASLSPDGRLAVLTRRPDTATTGGTVVLDRRTGHVIVAVTSFPVTGSAWDGNRVAILAQTSFPRTSASAVFIIEGSSQLRDRLRVPLP